MHQLSARRSVALLVIAVLAVGCGGSSDEGDSAEDAAPAGLPEIPEADWDDETGAAAVTIDTRDNTFRPQYVTVSPGTKVEFENRGRTPHNVVATEKDEFPTIPVDDLQPGDTAVLQLDDPGEYPYYCSLHGTKTAGMIGRIRVEG